MQNSLTRPHTDQLRKKRMLHSQLPKKSCFHIHHRWCLLGVNTLPLCDQSRKYHDVQTDYLPLQRDLLILI